MPGTIDSINNTGTMPGSRAGAFRKKQMFLSMENRRTGPLENRGAIDYNSKKRTALYFELHITEKGEWIMKKFLALSKRWQAKELSPSA